MTASGTPGPVVVVTGASRGLGAGLAEALAGSGMRLGLLARNEPPVPAGAEDHCVSMAGDVTDPGALDRLVAGVVGTFGRIDWWVNNAGLLEPVGPLADADPAAVSRLVAVNVTGVLLGSRAFARHVRDRPGTGVVVNISSGAATTPYEGWAPYCASKAAVDQATDVLALEGARYGLRAHTLSPGVVDTAMQSLIRDQPAERFPAVDRFIDLHARGAFNSPAWVGAYLIELCEGRTDPGRVHHRVPDEPRR